MNVRGTVAARKLKEGTHAHDVYVTSSILNEARAKGLATIKGTVDGDIFIYYEKGARQYKVAIVTADGRTEYTRALRRDLQAYLIDLREQRRKQGRGKKRGKQEDT